MRIIPAIDIIGGKCVRLSKGDYNTAKIYNASPLEIAKQFEDNGIKYLHLVDLDGAKSNHIVNYKILESIKSTTNLQIDFGGGLKSTADLKIAFNCGADQITGGSIAVDQPQLFLSWVEKFGQERIILGADCINRKIATHGWIEKTEWDIIEYIKQYVHKGIRQVVCTDIMKDGMLQGTANALYQEILKACQVNLIASGGVSSIEDINRLEQLGCEGVIVGKAIYEGFITLKSLSQLC